MQELAWPAVFILALIMIDRRAAQYLNPPLKRDLQVLKAEYIKTIKMVAELQSKVNSMMLDRGFK